MNLQPTLQNELVLLRPLHIDDKEAMYQVAKDPLIWEQHSNWDRYKAEVFDKFFEESLASKGCLLIFEKEEKKLIGSSRFKKSPLDPNVLEIGWSFLAREYWGGTYNRSFKQLMLAHAFQYVDAVIFYIAKENFRSQKATQKLGGEAISKGSFDHLVRNPLGEHTYIILKRKKKA
ncbi:MAG: GNAT family N-acetyltransferase [Bacteroidia bacterium]|nr:GNAT family N-acetyltransferase [Bacteroidia bacterium]